MATKRKTAAGRRAPRDRDASYVLAERLTALARSGELDVGADSRAWKSGVYALIDAVFRARARYASVVLPLLEERLPARPGMRDRASLTFSEWLGDVASLRGDPVERLEAYARGVLNRQRVGGRLKVEICCDVAAQLVERGLETSRQLRRLSGDAWHELAREHLDRVTGFGGLLTRHFTAALGRPDPLPPDRRTLRFAAHLVADALPDAEIDAPRVRAALERAAAKLECTPARLDVALHRRAAEAPRRAASSGGAHGTEVAP